MSFRKEKKFRLTLSDQKILKSSLLTLGMRELFPSRIINSTYFDTDHLDMYINSEEGILPRKKIRVRWYGTKKSLKKETKVSSIEGRYKLSEPFISKNFLSTVIFDINFLVLANLSLYVDVNGILTINI